MGGLEWFLLIFTLGALATYFLVKYSKRKMSQLREFILYRAEIIVEHTKCEFTYLVWRYIMEHAQDMNKTSTSVRLIYGGINDDKYRMSTLLMYHRSSFDAEMTGPSNNVVLNKIELGNASSNFLFKSLGWPGGLTSKEALKVLDDAEKFLEKISNQYEKDCAAHAHRNPLAKSETYIAMFVGAFLGQLMLNITNKF